MVSAKFHIVGEEGEWFRVRVQEEIYAHGLEGNVLFAGDRTIVVVVDGDKGVIKRFHSDVKEICVQGIGCGELSFSIDEHVRHARFGQSHPEAADRGQEYVIHVLAELERKITRIDQSLARLVAMHEGTLETKRQEPPKPEGEIKDEATSGFASMFGG
jgi:hypothetical protein